LIPRSTRPSPSHVLFSRALRPFRAPHFSLPVPRPPFPALSASRSPVIRSQLRSHPRLPFARSLLSRPLVRSLAAASSARSLARCYVTRSFARSLRSLTHSAIDPTSFIGKLRALYAGTVLKTQLEQMRKQGSYDAFRLGWNDKYDVRRLKGAMTRVSGAWCGAARRDTPEHSKAAR
jgi:hypothetical protein